MERHAVKIDARVPGWKPPHIKSTEHKPAWGFTASPPSLFLWKVVRFDSSTILLSFVSINRLQKLSIHRQMQFHRHFGIWGLALQMRPKASYFPIFYYTLSLIFHNTLSDVNTLKKLCSDSCTQKPVLLPPHLLQSPRKDTSHSLMG